MTHDPSLPSVRPPTRPALRLHKSLAVRLFHGLNLFSVLVMVGSGLEIYNANPVFGGRKGLPMPDFFAIGGWLAGGRHWHFFGMWVFALNLLWYGIYLLATVPISRRRYLGSRDLRALWSGQNPKRSEYAKHRLVFTLMVPVLLLALYTGLGMYKPVQFDWIVASIGGDWQALRIAHFLPVVLLLGLTALHLVQVIRVGGWELAQSIFVDAYRVRPGQSDE
ncbi:cytochrome b/b6 domain-containing protein [Leptolyngbya sp. FACHB-261]|uniref:cytochrome b/b6 domain-containing protein n=1 Tax=Leptolyngbya sp. FACHB-261 TaxID=2692806 RepID=UPI001684958F|nr:cytochrome b/b6 domain-containing protein [Leptolyngbya sp. FACHB-261]MBD2101246.1 cytochrome b/b6 domain-containing protein [Leptolyngbya sp. FACHB-261]